MTAAAPGASGPGAPVRLLCLPFAGCGASFFAAWRRRAPAAIQVVGMQLPGREYRLREPAAVTVDDAIEGIMPAVSRELDLPGPLGLFGHSLGAVLAFELAWRLQSLAPDRVVRLFVSGSAQPNQPRREVATGMPDDEFIHAVQRLAGYRHPALADPALRDLVLPALRADVEAYERYRCPADRRVAVPITALRGAADQLVSAADIAGWSEATTADFDSREIAGGHMYLTDEVDELLMAISHRLGQPFG